MEMYSLGKRQKSGLSKVKVCDVCGDRGFLNALIYCSECPDTIVHQYCVGIPPGSVDDTFSWVCEYCSALSEHVCSTSGMCGVTSTANNFKSFSEHARALKTESNTKRISIADLAKSLDILLPPKQLYSSNESEVDEVTLSTGSLEGYLVTRWDEQDTPVLKTSPSGKDIKHRCITSTDDMHYDIAEGSLSTMSSCMVSDDLKAARSPVSSFMEHPKEIMDGLVLLVSESGVVTIDEGMCHEYGDSYGSTTSILQSSNDIRLDKLVNESISSRMGPDWYHPLRVHEASTRYGETNDYNTNETIDLSNSSLETDDKIHAFPSKRLDEEAYSGSNLDDFGKTVNDMAMEMSESVESDGTEVEGAELSGSKSVKSSLLRRQRKRPRKLVDRSGKGLIEDEVKIVGKKQPDSVLKKHKRSLKMFENREHEEAENEAWEGSPSKGKRRKKGKDKDIGALCEDDNEVQDVITEEPCYVTLTGTYIHVGVVYLPMTFVKSSGLFKTVCEMTVIDEEGRSWDVKLKYKKYKDQHYIYHGWKDLQTANEYKPGDVITFKLLKAGIVPVLECCRSSPMSMPQKRVVDPQVLDTVAEILSASCHNPSYDATLANSSTRMAYVYLPAPFLKSSGLYQRICDMIIVDGKGRAWNVKLNYNKRCYRAYFSHGWCEYYDANKLEPGDVIRFQLLRGGKTPILKCSRLDE